MKHYYIRYPRNFANEYKLAWIESTDTESIAKATAEGFKRITRKEALRKVSSEKHARFLDRSFSGFGDIVVLPYNTVDLPSLEKPDQWTECFERTGANSGRLCFGCWTKADITVDLLSDDGIVFYPVVRCN